MAGGRDAQCVVGGGINVGKLKGVSRMKMRVFSGGIVVAVAILFIAVNCGYSAGWVTGHGRFRTIAGSSLDEYKELYEWDLYLSPADNSWIGPSRRLGAPPGQPTTGDGYYRIDNVPAGLYSIYVSQPDFFASPKVVPNVEIKDGEGTIVNVELDVDYSTFYFPGTWSEWKWDWYQTFKATGTSVRGVQWIMAGTESNGRVAILEDTGAAHVKDWTEIGYKNKGNLGSNSDQWVRWNSGDIPLTPGQTYAVHIHVDGGCAIYKRDRDEYSYNWGRAYHWDSSSPMPYDLNITVFVDKNNQLVTHTMDASKDFELHGELASQRWGQSFVATGEGLAAVDVFINSGNDSDDMDITWKIFEGGSGGGQIGPTKTTKRAYFTPHNHLMGVSYNPGEVPLTIGNTYIIELTDTEDFTAYVHKNPHNEYEDGQAFRNGVATQYDLAMTIMEYAPSQQPKDPDMDDDGKVTFTDYCILANEWSQGESPADIAPPPYGDGTVDSNDLGLFVDNWLTATTIPPLPGQASNPYPSHGATGISTTADLSWTPGSDATSYDVYLGTSSPGTFQGNQTSNIFDPGTMAPSTIYYWRIDSVNGWGKTAGQVWRFITFLPPPPLPP